MASTNKTVNYELSQFEGTDKPSWEADYNADMLAIDTNLKAVSDVANGASGDISTLDGRLTTAEGNISTNANDIDALEGRADALEAGQTSDDGRLDALEAEQLIQNTAIEGNTQLGYNLARPYDSASTYAVGAYVLFQNTLYKCTTAIATGEAFDPNKWLAIKATDEIASGNSIEFFNFSFGTGDSPETNPTFSADTFNVIDYDTTSTPSSGTATNYTSQISRTFYTVSGFIIDKLMVVNIDINVKIPDVTFTTRKLLRGNLHIKINSNGDNYSKFSNIESAIATEKPNAFYLSSALPDTINDHGYFPASSRPLIFNFALTPNITPLASSCNFSGFNGNGTYIFKLV